MRKWLNESIGLIFTVSATALTLITLSGDTQRLGFFISVGSLVAYLALVAIRQDTEE